jgi:quinol monooxygenase YgiN
MQQKNPEMSCGIEVAMSTSQGQRRELIQALEGLRKQAISDGPECACDVFEDLAAPNRFLWTEWWRTTWEADRAQASDRFRALLGAAQLLGTLEAVQRVSRSSAGTPTSRKGNQLDSAP